MKKLILLLLLIPIISMNTQAELWKQVFYINADHTVVEIQAPDSNECYVLYTNQRICKIIASTDGGMNWEVIHDEWYNGMGGEKPPFPTFPWSMSCPAKNWIYLGWETYIHKNVGGIITRSRDKGKSFDTLFIDATYFDGYVIFKDLFMSDSLTGIVNNSGGELFITKDGWGNYEKILPEVGQPYFIKDIYMSSYNDFSFLSSRANYGGYFYYSSDKGNSWSYVKLPTIDSNRIEYNKLYFINDTLGWIVGGEPTGIGDQEKDIILKTTNRGKKWEIIYRKENYPIFGIQDIAFGDEKNGVAVGDAGKVLRTTDGGENWFQENSTFPYPNNYFGNPLGMCVGYIGSKPLIGTGHTGLWMLRSTVDIAEDENNKDMLIYPNPCSKNQNVYLAFSNEKNNYISIELINVFNQKVSDIFKGFKEAGVHTLQFIPDVSLSQGAYWIKIKIDDNQMIKPIVILE
jgi:hypothetical protein